MDLIKGVNTSEMLSYINTIEMDTSVTQDFLVTILSTVFAVLLSAGLYWLFIVPWNFAKDFTEVSFNSSMSKQDLKNPVKKRDIINKLRRTRHLGESLPCPFPNGWYAILESNTLAKGKSTNVSCLGEQFVVYRTEKNQVFVLDAYCPHMGANLGVGGKVVGDSIVCPFHEWSFRGSDGKCNNIPYSTCTIPQSAKVRKWESLEANGYVFIWYHAENESPWQLPIVKEIEEGKLVYHGRNEYIVNSHIQDMPENGADLAHFTAIHNASFMAGGDPKNTFLRSLGKHHWEASWKNNEALDEKHIATVSITHAIELFHKMRFGTMDVKAIQIGPAYVQLHLYTVFGLVVILQATCPMEPLMQKVIHRFYGPPGTGPFMKFAIYGESVMFERDMNVWNHKKFASNPCLAKEDRCIKLFRQWYSQFYSENSKTFQQAKESLEW